MQLTDNRCNKLCSEFKLKNFGFDHDHQEEFYRSQWQSGERSWLFLLYRWTWALIFISIFVVCLILQFADGKFFIFLTNWGIMFCLLTQLLAAILVTRWHFNFGKTRLARCGFRGKEDKTSLLIKCYWLLYDVALPLALVITTVYWLFLHGKMNKPTRFPILSFVTHCLNSVLMLVDFLIVAFPVRLVHTLYAMLLNTIFCLFTVVYYFCDGTDEYGNHYIYPLLDWRVPIRGILTYVGVFGLYCIYGVLLFAVYKFKRFLHRSFSVMWSPHCVGLL